MGNSPSSNILPGEVEVDVDISRYLPLGPIVYVLPSQGAHPFGILVTIPFHITIIPLNCKELKFPLTVIEILNAINIFVNAFLAKGVLRSVFQNVEFFVANFNNFGNFFLKFNSFLN
jgi:hypothetical protein